MMGDAVDRAGLVVSLIREKTNVGSFLDKLSRPDFNNAHLPVDLRKSRQNAVSSDCLLPKSACQGGNPE